MEKMSRRVVAENLEERTERNAACLWQTAEDWREMMAESRGSAFWSALAGALGVSTGGRPETALLCLLPGWLREVRRPAAAPAGAERRRSEMRAERSPPVIERRFVIKHLYLENQPPFEHAWPRRVLMRLR